MLMLIKKGAGLSTSMRFPRLTASTTGPTLSSLWTLHPRNTRPSMTKIKARGYSIHVPMYERWHVTPLSTIRPLLLCPLRPLLLNPLRPLILIPLLRSLVNQTKQHVFARIGVATKGALRFSTNGLGALSVMMNLQMTTPMWHVVSLATMAAHPTLPVEMVVSCQF